MTAYDEWHKANTKYMEPQDIDAWCEAAWNAAIEESCKRLEEAGWRGLTPVIKEVRK